MVFFCTVDTSLSSTSSRVELCTSAADDAPDPDFGSKELINATTLNALEKTAALTDNTYFIRGELHEVLFCLVNIRDNFGIPRNEVQPSREQLDKAMTKYLDHMTKLQKKAENDWYIIRKFEEKKNCWTECFEKVYGNMMMGEKDHRKPIKWVKLLIDIVEALEDEDHVWKPFIKRWVETLNPNDGALLEHTIEANAKSEVKSIMPGWMFADKYVRKFDEFKEISESGRRQLNATKDSLKLLVVQLEKLAAAEEKRPVRMTLNVPALGGHVLELKGGEAPNEDDYIKAAEAFAKFESGMNTDRRRDYLKRVRELKTPTPSPPKPKAWKGAGLAAMAAKAKGDDLPLAPVGPGGASIWKKAGLAAMATTNVVPPPPPIDPSKVPELNIGAALDLNSVAGVAMLGRMDVKDKMKFFVDKALEHFNDLLSISVSYSIEGEREKSAMWRKAARAVVATKADESMSNWFWGKGKAVSCRQMEQVDKAIGGLKDTFGKLQLDVDDEEFQIAFDEYAVEDVRGAEAFNALRYVLEEDKEEMAKLNIDRFNKVPWKFKTAPKKWDLLKAAVDANVDLNAIGGDDSSTTGGSGSSDDAGMEEY